MYIPYGFFGEKEVTNCLTASQVGHENGLFQSGSDVWNYHIWSASGDYILEVTGSNTGSRVVLIGGGGYGGVTKQTQVGILNAERVAGGGGAGGVFDAPYTLVSRQFQIHVGSGSNYTASNGEDSWIRPLWQPNDPYPYSVYNSPSGGHQNISAEGGGFGGGVAYDYAYFKPSKTATQDAGSGGSGGGGAGGLMEQAPSGPGTIVWDDAVAGSGRNGQGFDAGTAAGNLCESTSEATATGGGGAGSGSPDTDCISSAGYQTPGGDGIELNIDGNPRYFAAGGGSLRRGVWENATLGLGTPGSGGSGSSDYNAGVNDNDDPGTATDGHDNKEGRDGLAAILIPLCVDQLSDCVQFELEGGATGGNFTFIPCGSGSLLTYTLEPNETTTVCGFAGNVNNYPSASGDVTYNKTTSSCELYIEPCPPDSGSCIDTGSQCTTVNPLNHKIYDITIDGGKSFAPTLAPAVQLQYTDCDHTTVVTEILNSGSVDMYDNIRAWNICADSDYGISASVLDGDATASVTVVDSGFICGEYCELIPLTEAPITASGGTVGTFNSGSYIYKYHIFESSGSSNEPFTRSYQEFVVTDGYTDEVNMIVVGPGGPGSQGSGSKGGDKFFGGGGGAGQFKRNNISGICNQYSIAIAPGFAQPWGNVTDADVWQETFGQTIVSASNGTLYVSSGQGGRGSSPNSDSNYDRAGNTAWNNRSGSVGGGATLRDPGIYASASFSTQQTIGGDGWSGSLTQLTGSAGGGGGANQVGFAGTQGTTALGGEGGNGIRLNMDGTLRYYAGGGAGYGPGGPSDGGLGGGGTSGVGLSTGSFYGGGGGAWIGPTQTYTLPWGGTQFLNGKGADGVVIINYKWKFNTLPDTNISLRGLSQFYDIYEIDSYDGTGSLVYSLWNEGTASLGNAGGWDYNTTVLGGSGSLEVVTSSLHPYVTTEAESGSQISLLQTWFSNNVYYDQSSSSYPILTDEQFGTSSFGMYAGDDTTYGEAVVIRIGDTEVTTVSGSAGNFVPRGGFHISQFSYDQSTNQLLWYVDGYSGSATVNEDIDIRDITLSFNSSSAVFNPDTNPVYPSASQATQYKITKDSAFGNFSFQFVQPQTNLIVSRSVTNADPTAWIFASTQAPQITNGTGSIESGSAVDYYPSQSLYPGRTARYDWDRWYQDSDTYAIDMYYNVSTCEWVATDYQLRIPNTLNRNAGENSWISYTWPVTGGGTTQSLDTNVTQSFVELNNCIYRPPVGLGDDSSYNLTAIYTASMTWEEMKHNDDYLYPRY